MTFCLLCIPLTAYDGLYLSINNHYCNHQPHALYTALTMTTAQSDRVYIIYHAFSDAKYLQQRRQIHSYHYS